MKKPQPKFEVGQVVRIIPSDTDGKRYFAKERKIVSRSYDRDMERYEYLLESFIPRFLESDIEPLDGQEVNKQAA
jgi:hypothetical protein